MVESAREDSGPDNRDDAPEYAVTWEEIGRELLHNELAEIRFELEGAFQEAEEALCGEHASGGRCSGDLTHDHVHTLRAALNRAREHVENHAAPVAGAKPWGNPPPRLLIGVMQELTDHPQAEGVDAREYIGEEEEDE